MRTAVQVAVPQLIRLIRLMRVPVTSLTETHSADTLASEGVTLVRTTDTMRALRSMTRPGGRRAVGKATGIDVEEMECFVWSEDISTTGERLL